MPENRTGARFKHSRGSPDSALVDAPLPASSDEQRAKQRITRAVYSGRQFTTEWEARMAVDIAADQLAQMAKGKRYAWVSIALFFAVGAVNVVVERPVFAAVHFAAGLIALVGIHLIYRIFPSRLEQARRVNAEVVDGPATRSRPTPDA